MLIRAVFEITAFARTSPFTLCHTPLLSASAEASAFAVAFAQEPVATAVAVALATAVACRFMVPLFVNTAEPVPAPPSAICQTALTVASADAEADAKASELIPVLC